MFQYKNWWEPYTFTILHIASCYTLYVHKHIHAYLFSLLCDRRGYMSHICNIKGQRNLGYSLDSNLKVKNHPFMWLLLTSVVRPSSEKTPMSKYLILAPYYCGMKWKIYDTTFKKPWTTRQWHTQLILIIRFMYNIPLFSFLYQCGFSWTYSNMPPYLTQRHCHYYVCHCAAITRCVISKQECIRSFIKESQNTHVAVAIWIYKLISIILKKLPLSIILYVVIITRINCPKFYHSISHRNSYSLLSIVTAVSNSIMYNNYYYIRFKWCTF